MAQSRSVQVSRWNWMVCLEPVVFTVVPFRTTLIDPPGTQPPDTDVEKYPK